MSWPRPPLCGTDGDANGVTSGDADADADADADPGAGAGTGDAPSTGNDAAPVGVPVAGATTDGGRLVGGGSWAGVWP